MSFGPEAVLSGGMNLDHIFNHLEIEADPFALCEIEGVCNVILKQDTAVTLHYVLAGEGMIKIPGHAGIHVSPGSLVLVPSLLRHELCSDGKETRPAPDCNPAELELKHVLANIDAHQAPSRMIALCAHIGVGLSGAGNLVDLLHEPLNLQISPDHPLYSGMKILLAELSRPSLGSKAMVRAVLLQAVIEMLRNRMQNSDGALHWMAALRDPTVWKSLQAMLRAPGDRHSVESLAEISGMSRSAFAKRFADAYGSGPMGLLRDLRMREAARLLRDTDKPVKRIAAEVGFSSRSAFSRQFEATTGHSPRAFRNDAKQDL